MIRALALVVLPLQAAAFPLDLPTNAVLRADEVSPNESYAVPTGPWANGAVPVRVETGEVRRQAWRIEAPGITTLQILDPLQNQLLEKGYQTQFSCTDEVCGGFDFRFGTSVIPAPDMHVDLGDFRFATYQGPEYWISLLASRSSDAGYLQIIRVGPASDVALTETEAPAARAAGPVPSGDMVQDLETIGRSILSDLTFETGSAQLGETEFASLETLAAYLVENPDRRVALVGHTDSVGSLEGNIALSKRRAGSVLERLVSAYGIPRRQLEAEGNGYLSPIATNLTEEGRDANRRVEVIMTSTE